MKDGYKCHHRRKDLKSVLDPAVTYHYQYSGCWCDDSSLTILNQLIRLALLVLCDIRGILDRTMSYSVFGERPCGLELKVSTWGLGCEAVFLLPQILRLAVQLKAHLRTGGALWKKHSGFSFSRN